ncbi:MAG: tetratricopeptide repeat protein [Candidatus Omnitrophica bacterium]|nr:tetratricopeptide repeat protein [Candidatus Omnitrophota bacterium]
MKNKSKILTISIDIALIAILGFLVYSSSLNGEFIADDLHLVKDNVYIKDWRNLSGIFSKDIVAGSGKKWNSYRPLQMLTYMIDYSFGGLNPMGYHLSNVVLHILVAISLYWLVAIIFGQRLLALLTALIFVVFPPNTQAVAYISGRADPLAAFFMLLCFVLYLKNMHSGKISVYMLCLFSYVLALLAKENSLILPLLLLFYHYSFKKRCELPKFLPIVVIACFYVALRMTILKPLLYNIAYPTTLLQRIPGFFVAMANYLRIMLAPVNLHAEYGNRLFSFSHPQALLGMAIVVFLFLVAWKKKHDNLILFAIGWFLITLLAQSNLYPLNAYMAEHWLYMPLMGMCLIAARFLSWSVEVKRQKRAGCVFAVILICFYSCLTFAQNSYWQDPLTFYKRTLKYVPDSAGAHNNLGLLYFGRGEHEKAIEQYKEALRLQPHLAELYNNLGVAYQALGEPKKAVDYYKRAIELEPAYTQAYNNMANIYKAQGESASAIELYKKALALGYPHAEIYNNLALAYIDIEDIEQAITFYEKALAADPSYAPAYYNLAVAYFRNNKYSLALEYCNKANELGFDTSSLSKRLKLYQYQIRNSQDP